MLTIHKQGKQIVTDRDMSASLEWVNPVCNFSEINGDVGLGLDLANNEYIRAEFGNPERVEKMAAANDRRYPNIELRFRGVLLQAGTMVVTSASKEKISAWLQSNLGTVGQQQRDKNITELPWPAGKVFQNKALYDESVDEYAILSVRNPQFWDGKGRETDVDIDYIDENGNPATKTERMTYLTRRFELIQQSFVNKIDPETGLVVDDGEACVISPFLFLRYAVKEIMRMNGFFIDEGPSVLSSPFYGILIYNTFNIFTQNFETFPYEDGYFDYDLNEWVVTNIIQVSSMAFTLETFRFADLVPRIKMSEFVLSLQNWLNVAFHFRNDNTVKVVSRNELIDAEAMDLDAYFVEPWMPGERKNVSLKFIQKIDENDNLFAEDWHDLSDRRADFRDPVATYDDLLAVADPQMGDLRLVIDEDKIYEYKWAAFNATQANQTETQTDVLQWTFASLMPQPLFYGDAEEVEELSTTISTLKKMQGDLVPQAKQTGNVGSARSLWSDYSLRCLPYGLMAINDSLRFDGESGLFAKRWETWARFWCNRLPIEGEFNLPLNVLKYMIDNITQPYRTRQCKFIIETMQCDFQGDQMGLVRIKGYKVE